MRINFYPNRVQMSQEVEHCIESNRLETLRSFCDSCMYRIFELRFILFCSSCEVHQGILTVVRKGKTHDVEDAELLGAY